MDPLSTSRRAFLNSVAASLLAWPLIHASVGESSTQAPNYAAFKDPADEYKGTAMWGYNLSTVTEDRIISGVEDLVRQRYGGFLITNDGGSGKNLDPDYMNIKISPAATANAVSAVISRLPGRPDAGISAFSCRPRGQNEPEVVLERPKSPIPIPGTLTPD